MCLLSPVKAMSAGRLLAVGEASGDLGARRPVEKWEMSPDGPLEAPAHSGGGATSSHDTGGGGAGSCGHSPRNEEHHSPKPPPPPQQQPPDGAARAATTASGGDDGDVLGRAAAVVDDDLECHEPVIAGPKRIVSAAESLVAADAARTGGGEGRGLHSSTAELGLRHLWSLHR